MYYRWEQLLLYFSGGRPDLNGSYILDTVPLSVEGCVDTDCTDPINYDPDEPIPVYAPFSGCLFVGALSTSGLQSDLAELKFGSNPNECNQYPITTINFSHLDPSRARVSTTPGFGNGGFVNQGDLIAYLCPQNSRGGCNLFGTSTHLATGMKSTIGTNTETASDTEIAQLFENLNVHDCLPQSIASAGFPSIIDFLPMPNPNRCADFGY